MFTSATANPKDDLAAKGNRTADDVRDGVSRVKADLRDAASNVRDDLQDIARSTGSHARELAESAEEALVVYMRENPLKSVGVAAGVGLILGALFFRR